MILNSSELNNFEVENPEVEIAESKGAMLVDFFASWCGPCKMMGPVLEKIHEKYGENVKIIKVDVDKHPKLADQYRVMSVPTLVFFSNGEIVHQSSGFMPENELCALIESKLMVKI